MASAAPMAAPPLASSPLLTAGAPPAPAPPPQVKLYGPFPAPNVQRAIVVLYEVGRPFDLVNVNLTKGQQREPWFLELSPFAATPALDDGEVQLSESRAICRYILETCDDSDKVGELLGRDARERAMINQWMDAEALSFSSAAGGIAGERLRKKLRGAPEDPEKVKDCAARTASALDVYERHLASHGGYLACDRVTLADLCNAPFMSLLEPAGFGDLISSRPHVAKWWESIRSRPSWQKVEAGFTLPKLLKSLSVA